MQKITLIYRNNMKVMARKFVELGLRTKKSYIKVICDR